MGCVPLRVSVIVRQKLICTPIRSQEVAETRTSELHQLLRLFIEIFTKDLKNSYLTSVVEQEVNNTILMSQELARRCVWLRTANPSDTDDSSDLLIEENSRRLSQLVAELKVG